MLCPGMWVACRRCLYALRHQAKPMTVAKPSDGRVPGCSHRRAPGRIWLCHRGRLLHAGPAAGKRAIWKGWAERRLMHFSPET